MTGDLILAVLEVKGREVFLWILRGGWRLGAVVLLSLDTKRPQQLHLLLR